MIVKPKNTNFINIKDISIKNIDIQKTVVSYKVSFGKKGFKYCINYNNARKIRPLYIFLPKMNAYRRDFDETKYKPFLKKDCELLEEYNELWEKVKISINKDFDSEPVCNEKYLKAKMKTYNGKIKTNFHNNKIPNKGCQCICLLVILIDSVFRTDKNYYPEVFLEECKHVVK